MQGPMVLSQGYFGVVGRQPIFVTPSTPDEDFGAPDGPAFNCTPCWKPETKSRFWGFVNAVINFEALFNGSDSRMKDLRAMGYLYKMHTHNATDGSEIVISRVSST